MRQSSISSFYSSYHERKSIRSPTRRFLLDITNGIILPGDSSGTSLDSSFDSVLEQNDSSTELKLFQPKSILKNVHVNGRRCKNGKFINFESESKDCEMLTSGNTNENTECAECDI